MTSFPTGTVIQRNAIVYSSRTEKQLLQDPIEHFPSLPGRLKDVCTFFILLLMRQNHSQRIRKNIPQCCLRNVAGQTKTANHNQHNWQTWGGLLSNKSGHMLRYEVFHGKKRKEKRPRQQLTDFQLTSSAQPHTEEEELWGNNTKGKYKLWANRKKTSLLQLDHTRVVQTVLSNILWRIAIQGTWELVLNYSNIWYLRTGNSNAWYLRTDTGRIAHHLHSLCW